MTYKNGIVWALGVVTTFLTDLLDTHRVTPIEIVGSLVMILGIAAVIHPPVRARAPRRAAEAQ